MKNATVVLCLMMMAAPAWAWESPVLSDKWESPELSGDGDYYIAPSHDVPLYVPLTDEQQELPTMDVYPTVLPPIRPYNPPGLAVYDETPMVTNPGVLPPLRPVYPPQ